MQTKVARAVAEALSAGYQVEPEAFTVLESLARQLDPEELVRRVVQAKKQVSGVDLLITKEDVERALPSPPEEGEAFAAEKPPPQPEEVRPEVEVLRDPTVLLAPLEGLEGYKSLFRSRLAKLMSIARQRPDSHQIQAIASLKRAEGRRTHKIAGLVLDRRSRRGHTEVTVDDNSGALRVLAMDERVVKVASEVLRDQLVLADVEFSRSQAAIARGIYSPDVPDHKPSYSQKRVYAVLTSDIHVGSKTFLLDAFRRFILWLNGRLRDDYITSRIKYLIVGGDLVDGMGVYPGQEFDLEERDVYGQFERLSQLFEQIPKDICVFLTPGNHDPVRQALPQPAVPRKYVEQLYTAENITVMGSPATLRLHGVGFLVFHGRSLDDVVATTPGLTYARPASAMKVLLKARHLAPIYGGRTPISPETEDHLVIEEVPDVFHAGHVHVVDCEEYKGTLILNSGAWQSQTGYQADMGISPTPGIVPVVDLSSLEVVTRDFTKPLLEA